MGIAPLAVLGDAPVGKAGVGDYVPHVVAWNLTRRCNLECAHCYISAGPTESAADELTSDECLRITDEILQLNPSPMFILSGGEPLLRDDLATIAAHATQRGATVVVGTNGTLLTTEKISELKEAGVTGVAVSIESLDSKYHDRFRRGHGSLQATLAAVDRLGGQGMDFVVVGIALPPGSISLLLIPELCLPGPAGVSIDLNVPPIVFPGSVVDIPLPTPFPSIELAIQCATITPGNCVQLSGAHRVAIRP